MPSNLIKSYSKNANISIQDAEHAWEKAKQIVISQYKKKESDSSFWALTNAITKKILGIKESKISFKQFIK